MTEPLYFDDPLRLQFEADVLACQPTEDGRFAARLAATYFYPTSGGQDHDTGTLGPARVLDVFKQDGEIVHLLDRSLPPGRYPAQVDADRRWRHMQNHTAQHILSATVWRLYGWPTLSSNIGGYSPSTIDVPDGELTPEQWAAIEQAANRAVFENRPLRTFLVDESRAAELPLRRPPKVRGQIRIVEIEGVDMVACGGTHAPRTGMLGLIKIIRTEHINRKLRLHFVAGYHALETFQGWQQGLMTASRALSVPFDGVGEAVTRLQETLRETEREAARWKGAALEAEAANLRAAARAIGTRRLVTRTFANRPADEVRALAAALQSEPGLVALLGTHDGRKLVLVAACGPGSGLSARDLLNAHLAPFGGRGGGDDRLAQGGGAVPADALDDFFSRTPELLA